MLRVLVAFSCIFCIAAHPEYFRGLDEASANDVVVEIDENYLEPVEHEKIYHPAPHVNQWRAFSDDADNDSNEYASERTSEFWNQKAQFTIRDRLLRHKNENVAKNVIFFLGDGMSIPTVTAARIRLGQTKGRHGEESQLSFEKFPYVGLSRTYCIDKQVADSACSATAYLGGVKANFFTIGVNGKVKFQDCAAEKDPENHVHSLAYWAQKAGKGTGIVTTTTVTNASPAGAFAHTSNRLFECDGDVIKAGKDPKECQDITSQLVKNAPGNRFKVILGGGSAKFVPRRQRDANGNFGERSDGENLIDLWKKNNPNGQYVHNKTTLDAVDINRTSAILGLFTPSHMSFRADADPKKEPSLQEMTEVAIKLLQKEEKGFFLFVEGGKIDHGNHETKAYKALDETIELHKAVEAAVQLTSRKDTLIVLTADHAHTLSISGYPDRGKDILGLGGAVNENLPIDLPGEKSLPITTLSYANGPGFVNNIRDGKRVDLSQVEFHKDFLYPTAVLAPLETHGGDDVAIYASGPFAHLFAAVLEQNVIPHAIRYASCIGEADDINICNY